MPTPTRAVDPPPAVHEQETCPGSPDQAKERLYEGDGATREESVLGADAYEPEGGDVAGDTACDLAPWLSAFGFERTLYSRMLMVVS